MTYDEFTKDTRQRQRELKLAGLYSGKVDGIDGPKTRAGWERWQMQAVQAALYAQGRTKKGKIVTKASAGYSNHNFGIAFDIGLFDAAGKYLEADAQYKALHAACGNPEGCLWGGDWSSIVDTPHYQLNKWGSSTAAVRAALEK